MNKLKKIKKLSDKILEFGLDDIVNAAMSNDDLKLTILNHYLANIYAALYNSRSDKQDKILLMYCCPIIQLKYHDHLREFCGIHDTFREMLSRLTKNCIFLVDEFGDRTKFDEFVELFTIPDIIQETYFAKYDALPEPCKKILMDDIYSHVNILDLANDNNLNRPQCAEADYLLLKEFIEHIQYRMMFNVNVI